MNTLVSLKTRDKIHNRILEEITAKMKTLKDIEQMYRDNGFTVYSNGDLLELQESFKEMVEFQLDYDKDPVHQHDCNACIYLCHVNGSDLYFCGDGSTIDSTVIERHGIDGDYGSGLTFAQPDMSNKLYIARIIAEEVELLEKK